MASTPRLPEQFGSGNHGQADFHVSELASDMAGSLSPFGQDDPFPWPVEKLRYQHPGPEDRPHLAGGR